MSNGCLVRCLSGKILYIAYCLDANGAIYSIKNGGYDKITDYGETWKTDDKITLILDCDDWKLTYYFNDKIHLKTVDIKRGITYYPALTTWFGNAQFHLIETPMEILQKLQKI